MLGSDGPEYFTLFVSARVLLIYMKTRVGMENSKVDVETPVVGFEEMAIPGWVGAGVCIGFQDIMWPEGHKHQMQEVKTEKQAVN